MFNKKSNRLAKKKWAINKQITNLKSLKINNFIKINKKLSILKKHLNIKKKIVLVRGNKNICSITGKYKSIFNSLKLSRHLINKLGNNSKLPNYNKLSW